MGDERAQAFIGTGTGLVLGISRSVDEGARVIRRAVETFERLDDAERATVGLVAATCLRGITRQFDDDALLRETYERAGVSGSDLELGLTEAALAQYRLASGDRGGALQGLGHSLEHLARTRLVGAVILTLEVVAELGLEAGAVRHAAELLGATAAIRTRMGTQVPPQAAARLGHLLEAARRQLPEELTGCIDPGAGLPLAEAIQLGRLLLAALTQSPW